LGQFAASKVASFGIKSNRRRAMTTRIAQLFTAHPSSVDESYFEHMAFAAWFSSRLMLAAGAALVHALLPFMFEKTASGIIRQLYERTHNRGR
jgi:hypothetical protein